MPKAIFREIRQPLFSFPGRTGVWGGVKDAWICWDDRIELMRRRSWFKRLLRRQDEPSWGPAFYDQIEDVRIVPHLGTDQDELIMLFKGGRPPFSLKAPRKNVEFVRSIILPRLNIR